MASQCLSPQLRTRKQQQQQQPSTSSAPAQSAAAAAVRRDRERESSPSPSLREQQQQQQQQQAQAQQRQRYARTQSMPIVATQTQAQDFEFEFDLRDDPLSSSSSTSGQGQGQGQQGQQAPATPYAQQRPVPIARASQPAYIQGRPPVGIGVGAVGAGAGVAEKWQMTDDLQADIDRADLLHQQQQQQQQHAAQRQQQSHSPVGLGGVALITIPPPGANPAPGTAGVAYAGGAASAGAAFVAGHVKSLSGSGTGVGVGDVMEGSSPGGASASASASASAASSAALARRRTIANEQSAHRASPLSYALRKGANTSPGYPGMTTTTSMPSPRSLKNRTPDRSLPVQEEPDEHDQQQQHQQQAQHGTGSGRVTPASAASSDHNSAKDLDHDGEGTLVDLSNDDDDDDEEEEESEERGGKDGNRGAGSSAGTQESTEGEGSHTPRSPTNALYPQSHGAHAHAHLHGHTLRSQRSIHEVLLPDKQSHLNGNKPIAPSSTSASNAANYRNGFNAQDFQQTLKKLQQSTSQSSSPYPTYPPYAPTSTHPPSIPPPPFSPFSRAEFSRNESRGSYPNWMFDFYHNYPAEDVLTGVNGVNGGGGAGDGYYEYDEAAAAASAYLQQFLPANSAGTGTGGHAHMRPDAPIPPTPHSQTSAPTPFRRQHQQQTQQQAQRRGSQDSRERSGSRVRQENGVANEDAEGEEEEEEEQDGGRDVVDDSIVNRDEQENSRQANANAAAASHERFVPSFSPIPPSGTPYPYPYPFSHVRRVGGYVYPRASHPSQVPPPPPSVPIHPGQIPSAIPRVPSSMYDYNTNTNGNGEGGGNDANLAQLQLEEQFRLQMQMYAYNNALGDNGGGGVMTDSTLSPSSTPYPGMSPGYTPFGAYLNQSRRFARARERAAVFNGGYGLPGPGEDGRVTGASMRSSPSHLPVSLPPMPPALYGAPRGRGVKKRDRVADLRGEAVGGGVGPGGGAKVNGAGGTAGGGRVKPPPRVDSTQPRETSPEPISEEDEDSGEETAGEKYEHEHREHAPSSRLLPGYNHQTRDWGRRANGNNGNVNGMGLTRGNDGENDVGEWVDEESDEEEELLDLEFHPSYVTNADRRRRRWEQRWEDLARAFQALDRETDATLLVLASPAHTNKLYSLSSRSIRRDAQLFDGHAMHAARGAFTQIAGQRRSARTQRRASLLERLYYASSALSTHGAPQSQDAAAPQAGEGERDAAGSQAQNGSPESGTGADAAPPEIGEREEDLRRILRTALHSLSALHQMYEEREARWRIEERRMREEREGVDLLVRQAFGSTGASGGAGGFMGMGGMGEQPFLPLP
ncbi:hypothetical protein ACEPAI_6560 [Sanghuangporus weigelae]